MPFGAVPTKPVTWSYSRLGTYETCPLQYRLQYVDKIPSTPSKAMQRGTDIHKLAEDYVKGELDKLPAELLKFKDSFLQLREKQYLTEQKVALDQNWQPAPWMGEKTWLRAVVDVHRVVDDGHAVVIDYKTGRKNEKHRNQLGLYAAVLCSMRPELQQVTAELWYLDSGELVDREFTVTDIPTIRQAFDARVARMLGDDEFRPKANGLCSWCSYQRAQCPL